MAQDPILDSPAVEHGVVCASLLASWAALAPLENHPDSDGRFSFLARPAEFATAFLTRLMNGGWTHCLCIQ